MDHAQARSDVFLTYHLAINRGATWLPRQKIGIILRVILEDRWEKQNRSSRAGKIVAKTRPDNLGPRGTRWARGGIADANTSQLRSVSSGWTLDEVSLRFRPRHSPLKWNKHQPLFRTSFVSFLSFLFFSMLHIAFFPSFIYTPRGYKALETWGNRTRCSNCYASGNTRVEVGKCEVIQCKWWCRFPFVFLARREIWESSGKAHVASTNKIIAFEFNQLNCEQQKFSSLYKKDGRNIRRVF